MRSLLILSASATALLLAPLGPATAAPAASPPGKLVFAELVTPDLAGSEHFYGALLGWRFRDDDAADPAVPHVEAFDAAGNDVAILVGRQLPPNDGRRGFWLPFLSTDDIDRTVALAEHYGGHATVDPHDAVGLGREAVIADPTGARVGLLETTAGDAPDLLPPSGGWIWCALFTPDPATMTNYYAALFGEAAAPAGDSVAGRHLILSSDGYARGSVNPLFAHRPGGHPRWLPFVRVDDVTAATGRVEALGGQVLVPPHDDRDGLPVAIVTDPGGGAIGLMQWSGNAS